MIKVLYLEDNPYDVKLIELEFKRIKFVHQTRTVENKEDFLTQLENYKPDIILSDLNCPIFSGLEAIDIVNQNYPNIPIIIVTGSENEETAVECMKHGAWDYVQKKSLIQIHQAVQNALELKTERQSAVQTRERMENMISNLPGVVFRCSYDSHWTMQIISDGCEMVTGYSAKELINNKVIAFGELIYPDDFQKIQDLIDNMLSSHNHYQLEYRIINRNNDVIWVWEKGKAILQGSKIIALEGFFFDITDKKNTELTLIKREAEFADQSRLLNGVFNSIPDVMGIQDKEKHVLRYNQAGYDYLNLTENDLEGKLCFELGGYPYACEICATDLCLKTKQPAKTEKYLESMDRWLDVRAYPILNEQNEVVQVIEHLRDITDQKVAEQHLKASEKLSRAVIENSPLAISILDRDGNIIFHNNAYKKVWGLKDDETIPNYNETMQQLCLVEENSYLKQNLEKINDVYLLGKPIFIPEIKISSENPRSASWISQRFYAITDESESVYKVVLMTEDISERKYSQLVNSVLHNIGYDINIKHTYSEILSKIHSELSRIIDTKNFFIALKDQNSGKISFPYCSNELVTEAHNNKPQDSLTSFLINSGKATILNAQEYQDLIKINKVAKSKCQVKSLLSIPMFINNKTIGIVTLFNEVLPDLYKQLDLRTLELISSEIANVINNKQIEDQIEIQKIYFENLFEISPDALVVISNDKKVMQINKEFTKLFGYTNSQAIGQTIDDLILPEGEIFNCVLNKNDKIKSELVETKRKAKSGELIDVSYIWKPIIHKNKQLAIQGIFRDIRTRLQTEEIIKQDLLEKKTLLQELYHRTKNNMQVISSLLYMSSRRIQSEEVKEIFQNINNKIKTMSLVHKKLYQSNDLSRINLAEYLEDLIKLIIDSFGDKYQKIKLDYDLQDIPILMDSAIPLGLVINELITNMLKYAFTNPSENDLITLRLKHTADGEIVLILKDNGPGIPEGFSFEKSSSLGLKTSVKLIMAQLKGSIRYHNEDGLVWKIIIKDDQYKPRV